VLLRAGPVQRAPGEHVGGLIVRTTGKVIAQGGGSPLSEPGIRLVEQPAAEPAVQRPSLPGISAAYDFPTTALKGKRNVGGVVSGPRPIKGRRNELSVKRQAVTSRWWGGRQAGECAGGAGLYQGPSP